MNFALACSKYWLSVPVSKRCNNCRVSFLVDTGSFSHACLHVSAILDFSWGEVVI